MLIKGLNLNSEQRRQVLSAFIYRWTTDNPHRDFAWQNVQGQPQIDPISDEQWLADHAFHFVKDGSRLMVNRHYVEPAFMAD